MNNCKQQMIVVLNINNESKEAVEEAVKQLAEAGYVAHTCHTTDQGYDIAYVQNDKGGEPIHISHLKNCDFSEKKQIRTFEFEKTIDELKIKMNDYLNNFVTRKVRVIVDSSWEKTDQSKPNSCWKAKISKATADTNDQTGLEYIITIRNYYLDNWSQAQIVACLFDLLSSIQEDGSIRKPHMDDDNPLVNTFGSKFLESGVNIENLLKDKVNLKMVKKATKAQQELKFDDRTGDVENPAEQEEGPQDDSPTPEEKEEGPEELVTH